MALGLSETELPVIYDQDPDQPTGSALSFTKNRAIVSARFSLHTVATAAAVPCNQAHKLPDVQASGSALLVLEAADGAVAGSVLARYWQNGELPTSAEGFPLRDGEKIEIKSTFDIKNFRIISADDRAHTIQVQYYTA